MGRKKKQSGALQPPTCDICGRELEDPQEPVPIWSNDQYFIVGGYPFPNPKTTGLRMLPAYVESLR